MYPVNPLMLIAMMKQGRNPQQLLMSILEGQANTNPVASNLLDMAREGRTGDIEAFARNYFSSNGLDFDKEFNSFKETYGIK